ncbi:Hypothetical predicted protein, partial [Paramuricea clavata]
VTSTINNYTSTNNSGETRYKKRQLHKRRRFLILRQKPRPSISINYDKGYLMQPRYCPPKYRCIPACERARSEDDLMINWS